MSLISRATTLTALFLGMACIAVQAQSPPPQQKPSPPVFRSAVDIAVIDVTVVDDKGAPVRGLSADDFIVTVAGERRRIQALDFLEFGGRPLAATSVEPPAPASTTVEPPTTKGPSRGGRIIVVAVDDLASKPVANAGLLAAAERILVTLDPTDLVGLVTTSGYGPVVAPTSNRDEFRSALRNKTIVGRNDSISTPFFITTKEAIDADNGSRERGWLVRECPPGPNTDPTCAERALSTARRLGAEARHRRDEQLGAYATIIEGLKTMPRPRVLIVLGQGLALDASSARRDEIDRVGRLAADADVRFYSLNDIDDDVGASIQGSADKCDPPGCIDHHRAMRNEGAFLLDGMKTIAAATGGEAIRAIGQADRFLERVLVETSGIYRLGVEVPHGVADKYPDLKVTTARRGLTIRSTRRLAPDRNNRGSVSTEEALRQRIALGGHAFGVPMTVAALMRGDPMSPLQDAAISLRVPAGVPAPLSLMFALIDDKGKVAGSRKGDIAARSPGEDYEVTLLVPVGPSAAGYRLRVAVADADGRIGSVESRVMNALVTAGPIRMSQIFLNWSTTEGRNYLAFDVAPKSSTALSCTMDVYPGAKSPSDLGVRFFFYRDGSTTTELEREVALVPSGSALAATITVPIADLPAGLYSVTATVMDAGRALGSQAASFTVGRR